MGDFFLPSKILKSQCGYLSMQPQKGTVESFQGDLVAGILALLGLIRCSGCWRKEDLMPDALK